MPAHAVSQPLKSPLQTTRLKGPQVIACKLDWFAEKGLNELVIDVLSKKGLNPEEILYTAASPDSMADLKASGLYSKQDGALTSKLFCCVARQGRNGDLEIVQDGTSHTLYSYAKQNCDSDRVLVVLYDRKALIPNGRYEFVPAATNKPVQIIKYILNVQLPEG